MKNTNDTPKQVTDSLRANLQRNSQNKAAQALEYEQQKDAFLLLREQSESPKTQTQDRKDAAQALRSSQKSAARMLKTAHDLNAEELAKINKAFNNEMDDLRHTISWLNGGYSKDDNV